MPNELLKRIDESSSRTLHLDKKDTQILTCLLKDARAPINSIAKKVGLSKDSIIYRIKRLKNKQIILGFFPKLNFQKLGYEEFHLFLLLDEKNKEKQNEFIDKTMSHPNVTKVMEYSGRWDFEICILAKTLSEFDVLCEDIISGFQDMIMQKEKTATIYFLYHTFAPGDFREEKITEPSNCKKLSYDEKDLILLSELAKDGRASTYKISEKVKLSPDTVRLRIKKLKEQGIIEKFTVKLNLSRLGYQWQVFVSDVSLFDHNLKKKIEYFVRNSNSIISTRKLLGYWDVRVDMLSKNHNDYHRQIEEIKREFSNVIRGYQTWLVYKELLFNPFPLVFLK